MSAAAGRGQPHDALPVIFNSFQNFRWSPAWTWNVAEGSGLVPMPRLLFEKGMKPLMFDLCEGCCPVANLRFVRSLEKRLPAVMEDPAQAGTSDSPAKLPDSRRDVRYGVS